MRCVWQGSMNVSPSATATSWTFINACQSTTSWGATETQRSSPISEDIVITRITVWLGTAPGVGTSYAFTVRAGGANTGATVTVSGAATTATWTGAIPISALSSINLQSVPTSTPQTPGSAFWVIEYTTAGNFYLIPAGQTNTLSPTATDYAFPSAGNSESLSTTNSDWEVVFPTNATLTKLVAQLDTAPGTSKSYAISVTQNETTDQLTTTLSGATTQATTTGSISLSPGDTLVLKSVPTSTPAAARLQTCMTVVPKFNGEIASLMGSSSGPSTTATTYQQPYGTGASTGTWSTTESARQARYADNCTMSKLYVKVMSSPGGSWIFTLRENGSSTALTATISGSNTTANDTTDSFAHTDGNLLDMQVTRSGSDSSSGGAKFGFVQTISQDVDNFFVAA